MQKFKERDRKNKHTEKEGTKNSLMFENKLKFTVTLRSSLSVGLQCVCMFSKIPLYN